MKLSALLENQEFIPRSDPAGRRASDIAQQLIRVARTKSPRSARRVAHQMADKFASMVAQEIDREFEFSQMKSVDDIT